MSDWQPIETAPERIQIETKIHDEHGERNAQLMTRRGCLWWIGEGTAGEMYVYYQPTHWRPRPARLAQDTSQAERVST